MGLEVIVSLNLKPITINYLIVNMFKIIVSFTPNTSLQGELLTEN